MIGGVKQRTIGSRAEVWHGSAKKTSGGLTKSDLIKNKHGRIVSKKKHSTAKKEKRLVKAGYGTKKGKFGYVMKNGKTSSKKSRSRKHRGGMNHNGSNGIASNSHNYGNDSDSSSSGPSQQKMMMMQQQNSSNNGSSNGGPSMGPKMASLKGGRKRKSRKMTAGGLALSPTPYDGKGVGTSGVDLQFVAGNAG
jgi:hypothetical protein